MKSNHSSDWHNEKRPFGSRFLRVLMCAGVSCILSLALNLSAMAVITPDGDGTLYQSAPPDDPGWSNAGRTGAGSAVYLGNRWVLTAGHAGAGTITLPSGSFAQQPGAILNLTNPSGSGLSSNTDIRLYRLATDPGLPTLTISSSTIPLGASVTMIGAGRAREPDRIFWDVSESPPGTWNWNETTNPAIAEYEGFRNATARPQSWGTNNIIDMNGSDAGHTVVIDAGLGEVVLIGTRFDDIVGNAQPVSRDSGGGVFYKNGAQWELGGMMLYVGYPNDGPEFDSGNSPPSASTRPLIGSFAFSADLSFYRDQIMTVLDPLKGDMNINGVIDDGDISLFVQALTDPSAYLAQYPYIELEEFGDIDGNGFFNLGDVKPFIALFPGSSGISEESFNVSSVPEPASFGLLLAGLLSWLTLCRRRFSRRAV